MCVQPKCFPEYGPLSDTPPRERVRYARRAALLQAAECVFAEHGFAGATVADIASRAGYSAGNVYNVFENKEALFREVIATRGALFVEQLAAALEGGGPIGDVLDRFIDVFLGFGGKHRAFFTILSQPTENFEWGTGSSSERSTHIRDTIESKINDFFARAVDAREIPLVSPHVYGAFAGLAAFGMYFGRMGQIGLLMLMGLVMKNGILLVDYTNKLRADGHALREAILEAGPTRLRPVLMTTLSTVVGMAPLAFGNGDGCEMRNSLGIIAMGGLMTSMILTLIAVPVFDSLVDDATNAVQRFIARISPSLDHGPEGTVQSA